MKSIIFFLLFTFSLPAFYSPLYLVFWQKEKSFHHIKATIIKNGKASRLYSENFIFYLKPEERIQEIMIFDRCDHFIDLAQWSMIKEVKQ